VASILGVVEAPGCLHPKSCSLPHHLDTKLVDRRSKQLLVPGRSVADVVVD
jgi:hypothetical protein